MERHSAGELRERISLCAPGEGEAWGRWVCCRTAWAKVRDDGHRTIFSSVGLSAETKLFTVRAPAPCPGQVILWRGGSYYVTAAETVQQTWATATTAAVHPVQCAMEGGAGEFTAFVTEPYERHDRPTDPYAVNVERRVLVTAKNVALRPGRLVSMDGALWPVRAAHLLDAVKNEYELERVVEL